MPAESNHGDGSHIYGFPNTSGQDRHIQNIISHTDALFPDRTLDLPFSLRGVGRETQFPNPIGQESAQEGEADAGYLDDFDLQLLGRHSTSSYSCNTNTPTSRVSLPRNHVASTHHQPRVIGDASHHFRPFVPRSEVYQTPQFISNPININQLNPSPASRHIFDQDRSYRVSELQTGSQLVTPPFYAVKQDRVTPQPHSSSPLLGTSSPSARLALRKREHRSVVEPHGSQSCSSSNIKLSLDHAPTELTPKVAGARLVNPRQALPDKCAAVFPYELFNAVQSKSFPLVYGSNDNVVISAPTGSGKTVVLELAICKLVTSTDGENFKIVYQAPTKSLCSERARDWDRKFSHLNLRCIELTGDTSQAEAKRVGSASIIITTPEKWDSITRKWSDHRKLLEMIRLVLIDEVHILKDVRGATLEAVVSRMKTSGANVRFVALSATVPNITDIATWLGRDHAHQHQPAKWISFGEEMRPVKLKKHVYGYDNAGNDFIFDKTLDGKLNLLVAKYSERKPIIVFCFTRKSCEHTAQKMAEWWTTVQPEEKPWPAPTSRVPVVSKELQEIVRYGVAFHHAGLDVQDKASIESHYLAGQLHVICCTSTLAVGVNLPCHTVVLKGTTAYTDDGPQEYSDLEVMQMLGRAGRPQFDRSATAIIMTRSCNVQRYERMVSGQEVLESKLHLNLIEHLNSEVGLGTIGDLESAKRWISGTFLNVRMREAPDHYHLNIPQTNGADTSSEERLQSWCERDIKLLQQHSLITEENPLSCTEYGVAMSRYMVPFATMQILLAIPVAADLEHLLVSLCKTRDFRDFRFRPAEKTTLRTMNQSVMFPIKGTISDTWHKIFLMVQVHLAALELPPGKETDIIKRQTAIKKRLIFDRLNRLVQCVIDCKVADGDGPGARVGLELARALMADSWEAHPAQLRQVNGIGPVAMRKLTSHGIENVLELAGQEAQDLERIMSRNPPYGKNMLKLLDGFPRLTMHAELVKSSQMTWTRTEDTVSVMVNVRIGFENSKSPSWKGKSPAVALLVETTSGALAYFWRNNISTIKDGLNLQFPVAVRESTENVTCFFSCEDIVGTQVTETIYLDVPASVFQDLPKRHGTDRATSSSFQDSSYDEGLADQDMLDALDTEYLSLPCLEYQSARFDKDFPDIDNVLDVTKEIDVNEQFETEIWTPVQLDNGRWMCNHHCAGGELTKNGKPCSHKCCHEGLEKPRPPPHKKKAPSKSLDVTDQASANENTRHQPREADVGTARCGFSAQLPKSTKRSESLGLSQLAPDPSGQVKPPKPSLKRVFSPPADLGNQRKKPRSTVWMQEIDGNGNGEYIDLCAATDEEEDNLQTNHFQVKGNRNNLQKLDHLHSRVQSGGIGSTRLTKPCNPVGNSSTKDQSIHTSHYESKTFEDEAEEFPDIYELVRNAEGGHEMGRSGKNWKGNETLCPSVVESYKESKENGWEPSLSFTTVSELEKASQRFDIEAQSKDGVCDNQDNPSLTLPGAFQSSNEGPSTLEMSPSSNLQQFNGGTASGPLDIETDREPLIFDVDPFQVAVDVPKSSTPFTALEPIPNPLVNRLPDEPAWVSEFDPELIDMFRGHVEFVD
ncbi:hypothetical protein JX266_005271 [Neoarthrinium moseri]|nr:hypothetical protein JX266_005271 [Neoarthrinium moseri]